MTRKVQVLTLVVASILLAGTAPAQSTQRVSVPSGGGQGNNGSGYYGVSMSGDGRYVAFDSFSINLVPGDTNAQDDVFVRDRSSGTTERVSISTGGAEGLLDSRLPSISVDGRFVAFESAAFNLVPGDHNSARDILIRDRILNTTELVSISSTGGSGNADCTAPCLSSTGRFVAFESYASNLVPGDTNGVTDIFVRDRQEGTTERVSISSAGAEGTFSSQGPSISADGRYVAFWGASPNFVPGDTNGDFDVFLRDRQLGVTEIVSVDAGGSPGNGSSGVYGVSVSGDGRYVAFVSSASNLVPGDTNSIEDVFVRDRQTGTTERVSVDSFGNQENNASYFPWISADGRYVVFSSLASNLVPGDTNGVQDIFLRDRVENTTERISVDSSGVQGNSSSVRSIASSDGRYVAIESYASNLVPGDTNSNFDVFVRDRLGGTGFASMCSPGDDGVIHCPCGNPAVELGRGCENSTGTGGASLSAIGGTYLSSDSLVFRTSGESPHALSIVMQGNGLVPSGVVYGQGVRCLGGSIIRRLFIKPAVLGSIVAPDFGAGDSPVSARSAAKGDVIQTGESRYYLVYYRDPIVLGGCPAGSTFNCTQTGRVDWSP